MHPKLTVGVPHLDRTEFLGKTIEHLLDQSVPCRIVVADQGRTDATFELMQRYKSNPLVSHVPTEATCLWENWRAAADAAMDDGAEYFAWCQDDDIVRRQYGERINLAFDHNPDASTWCARLAIAQHERLAICWKGPGPYVPNDVLHNLPTVIPGELMTPMAYITSWALSPAAAFRCGDDFRAAMEEVPKRCDLYTERTILAAMGRKGRVVCDQVIIGFWRHHTENVSYRQNLHEKPAQEKAFLEWLDARMDDLPGWEKHLSEWAAIMPNDDLGRFLYGLEGLESRYVYAVADVLSRGMKEQVLYEDLRRELNHRPGDPLVI
jgi:glycosyltransferase involved in cell wall biosynthesis